MAASQWGQQEDLQAIMGLLDAELPNDVAAFENMFAPQPGFIPGPTTGLGSSVKMEDVARLDDDGADDGFGDFPAALNGDSFMPTTSQEQFLSMPFDADGASNKAPFFQSSSAASASSSGTAPSREPQLQFLMPAQPRTAGIARTAGQSQQEGGPVRKRPQLTVDIGAASAAAASSFAPKALSPQNYGFYRNTGPAPPTPGQAASSALLNKLHMFEVAQTDQIRDIRRQQAGVLAEPSNDAFTLLKSRQENLKRQVDTELRALRDIERTVLMPPADISRAFYLAQSLQVQATQLELLYQELMQLATHQRAQCYAALVIAQQCFPMVLTKRVSGIIKKDTSDDAPTELRLLLGASAQLSSLSEVHASVVFDVAPPVAKGKKAAAARRDLEVDHIPLQAPAASASFGADVDSMSGDVNLEFLNGTRKSLARVKFSVELRTTEAPDQLLRLESHPTQPLVVITNECQFEESASLLLRTELFGDCSEGSTPAPVPWMLLANKLQMHFLRATRQNLTNPQRYLTRPEFDYMHHRMFNSSQEISVAQFETFWNWFGKTLQKVRYTRAVTQMWQAGLIYPFTGRESVNAALQNQEPGVFLVRLSERVAGSFSVAYTIDGATPGERVRHYLLRPEDVHPKKSLPEFLSECPQFEKVMQVSFDPMSGEPRHRIVDKTLILESFGAKKVKKSASTSAHGYDVQLINAAGRLNLDDAADMGTPDMALISSPGLSDIASPNHQMH